MTSMAFGTRPNAVCERVVWTLRRGGRLVSACRDGLVAAKRGGIWYTTAIVTKEWLYEGE